MALTRAQLLMGDGSQGFVLPGQVQGVKEGNGITILPNGTIEIDSQTIVGVMRLGQTKTWADSAYNGYYWPLAVAGADVGKQLTITSIDGNGDAVLEWQDSDGIDWTARGQLIAATGAGETNDGLVNIGSARSFLMSQVDNVGNPTGFAYSDVITSAMKIPAGTQGQRPGTPSLGETRFDTTQGKLEVWTGEWQTIASEDPADGSYVRQFASTVIGQTDVAAIPSGTTAQRITAPAPQEGFLRFNSDPNASYGTDGSMEFWDGTNWITVAAIPAPSGFVSQTASDGAAIIPSGNNLQRPTSPAGGYLRYNTLGNYLEFFNSATTTWEIVTPAAGAVHSFVQSATPTAFNAGDIWYNTTLQRESVWDGAAWVQPGVSQSGPTGFATMPAGTTVQRGAPVDGGLRLNTDTDKLEFFNGTVWQEVASGNSPTPPIPATVVSSVDVSGGTTGFSFAGGPITSSGTMTMSGALNIANGGTGATSGAAALSGMGMSVNVSGGTTGLSFTGGPVTSAGTMTMAGTLAIANGGTGQTTATAALNALLPSQGGNANKALITNGTSVSWGDAGFLTGTRMPFAQAAAPTGWTQDTSAAVNDSAIRLVTGAGGGAGGSLNFSTVFVPAYPISGTITFTAGNVGATTLSGAQGPYHQHMIALSTYNASGPFLVIGGLGGAGNGFPIYTGGPTGGGGGSHTHSLAGASSPATLNGAFNVKYVDMIICTKN